MARIELIDNVGDRATIDLYRCLVGCELAKNGWYTDLYGHVLPP
jgi:hypothetical protein